jgi:MFS transporter, ACS family, tartrate transporter
MIPYLVALAAMVLVGRSSDTRGERRYHAAIPLIIGGVAFILLSTISTGYVFLSVTLWCLVASGMDCAWIPIWSLAKRVLDGVLSGGRNRVHQLGRKSGRFIGPHAMGAIKKITGGFNGGLVFAGISWFISTMLLIAFPRGAEPDAAVGVVAGG